MAKTLYKRQRQILELIRTYLDKYGCAPTLVEIAEKLGLRSLSTVHEHLSALEKKGLIRRYKGSVRGIEMLDEDTSKSSVVLPVLGMIAAGSPIEPMTDPGQEMQVACNLLPSGQGTYYVLLVKGDSMIEEGILDGDHVVVQKQETAHDGDIVVAVLENGFATLKRIYWETDKGRIRLQPANSQMRPIYVNKVTIQGKVTGIVRSFS